MRIKNTTEIPTSTIRELIDFCKPSGIKNFDVMIKNGSRIVGRAYIGGSRFHSGNKQFIVCRIPRDDEFKRKGVFNNINYYPRKLKTYQIGQLKGRRYYLANRTEATLYLIAHELRHLWQSKMKSKAGYFYGSKGKFSEIDTESYAIRTLRRWRRRELKSERD